MQLRNLDPASTSDDWDRKWVDIFDGYQNDRRHAYYVHAMLNAGERHVLELGAGSFRDMAELRRRGVNCEGMDFSREAVDRAKRQFGDCEDVIHHMSAFSMPFADRAFDVSYHNGFWVLFSDEQLRALSVEQARITRGRMIATVHNAHNREFVDYFMRKSEGDPLYDIRFFEVDEISEVMMAVCRDVVVVPVGKGKRYHEDLIIRAGITSPIILRNYLRLSGHRLLEGSERLMCIGVVR